MISGKTLRISSARATNSMLSKARSSPEVLEAIRRVYEALWTDARLMESENALDPKPGWRPCVCC
jgi:hypothetical protein